MGSDCWPRSRDKHASCVCCGYIYVFGGRAGHVGLRDAWRYDIGQCQWEKVELEGIKLPYLEGHTCSPIGDKIYIFGGNFESHGSSSLWVVDTKNYNCISSEPENTENAAPLSRRGHTGCSFNEDLYIFGGFVDFLGSTNELWKYSSAQLKWELLFSGQNVFKFYNQRQSKNIPGYEILKVDQSNNNSIQAVPSLFSGPDPRHYHASAVAGSFMFIHGGMFGDKILNSFWKWNLLTSSWDRIKTKLAPPPIRRHSLITIDSNTLLMIGGENDDFIDHDFVCWIFNIRISSWSKFVDFSCRLSQPVRLCGFIALNVTEQVRKGNGNVISFCDDLVSSSSVENVTETTNSSCSRQISSHLSGSDCVLNFYSDDMLELVHYSCSFNAATDNLNCEGLLDGDFYHQNKHIEAVNKLAVSHFNPNDMPVYPFASQTKTSTPLHDIEMENLNETHRLIQKEKAQKFVLTFDNDCFESTELKNKPSNYRLERFLSHDEDVRNRLNSPDCDYLGENKCMKNRVDASGKANPKRFHTVAIVGGKQKQTKELTVTPMSTILLSFDELKYEISNVSFH